MNIGMLAKKLGLTTVTIRHYEKVGLLSPKRSQSGYRQYDNSTIERIKFIENTKFLGFKLSEIKELFSLEDKNLSSLEVKQKVQLKLKEINEKLSLLTQLQHKLIVLDQSCDGSKSVAECPIMQNLYAFNIEKKE